MMSMLRHVLGLIDHQQEAIPSTARANSGGILYEALRRLDKESEELIRHVVLRGQDLKCAVAECGLAEADAHKALENALRRLRQEATACLCRRLSDVEERRSAGRVA